MGIFRFDNKRTLLLALLFLFGSCSSPTDKSPSVPQSVEQQEIASNDAVLEDSELTPSPSPSAEPVINPLTGLPVSDSAQLSRKPIFIKIGNYPVTGRPHAGLSAADMIFEYYIGFGQNRFMALYYEQDADNIGPVRSGRRVDPEIVQMYSGVLGYGSADADTDAVITSILGNYAVNNLEAPCPAFCGKSTHDATGVFASSSAISDFVDSQGWKNGTPDLPGMVFSQEPPEGMKPAGQLTILYNYHNRGEWRFDVESGKYLRLIEQVENAGAPDEVIEMIPLIDRNTGEQLSFSNVIVMFAKYNELALSAHEIEIWANNDGKNAYLFRDGGLIPGKWASPNDTDPIQFMLDDGSPMPLKPGKTWIAIMGLSSSFTQAQPGQWETFFFLP